MPTYEEEDRKRRQRMKRKREEETESEKQRECEIQWKTPQGKSPARTSLVGIHGGTGRHYAEECENNLYEFENTYQNESWFKGYIGDKSEYIKNCMNSHKHSRNPNYSGEFGVEGWGGAKTTRSKKNRSKKNRKTRKARK